MYRVKTIATVISAFLVLISACNSHKGSSTTDSSITTGGSSTPDGSTMPVEFASLGNLASMTSSPQSFDVDKNAQQVDLGNGMSLQIPAGAFSSSTQLVLSQVEVAFDKISFTAKQSTFYVLSPRDEVGSLSSPLLLTIPIPIGDVTVVQYDGQNWQAVKGTPGQTAQIKITHFSSQDWGDIEWRSEQDLKEDLAANPALADAATKQRDNIENRGDALTHSFFGVGEAAIQSQDQMCSEIMDVLEQFNSPKNREFPSDSGTLNLDLAPFLFVGSSPSSTGGYYYDITKASLDKINKEVLASKTLLSPADVLKISIEANGGNIPLGVLAAHNYLKNIKYNGIYKFKYGQPFPQYEGLAASHLASWRADSNITTAGEYDKMGPLYHIFAAMTAGVWFPTRLAGNVAINGEAMLRSFSLLNDHPDVQKAAADACGQDAAVWLRENPPTENQAQPPSAPPNTSPTDKSGNWHGVACDEAEGTYIYRWEVSLMQDPNTGDLKGTVKFHDCPGGGRVLYSVVGNPPTDSIYTLNGARREGGGALFNTSPENQIFTLDSFSGTIDPNLAP